MSLSFGGNKSKSSTVNPLATQAYTNAQVALPASYSTLTPAQIQAQQNPYTQDVVNATTKAFNQNAAVDQQHVNDQAIAAGAFGGSRHGVQAGVTAAQDQLGLSQQVAQLNSQGFTQAQQTAEQENQNANQYPLAIQALLGQLAANTGSKTTGSGMQVGASYTYGK